MVNYRRNLQPGAHYFFTVTLQDRRSTTLTQHINELKTSFKKVKDQYPYKLVAYVILPKHLHVIWNLPNNDCAYPKRWRLIKSHFTQALLAKGITLTKNKRGEYKLWQRRYWEHTLRDGNDLKAHIDYIHYNPMKHGLVQRAADWEYSSFHYYVETGVLPKNWGGDFQCMERSDCFGE